MTRRLNLRQIEAFKAVIEFGTISRAAEMLNVSQPAMSKLIGHLEADAGLRLFDRVKGRLAPTRRGMRLYEEIDRIFAGVRQIENAVDAIRRDEHSRLHVGVLPALSGAFIRKVTTRFVGAHPDVLCSIWSQSSQWIAEGLVAHKLDAALVASAIDNPYIVAEPLMPRPVVCILPLGHPLGRKRAIAAADIDGAPFVSFAPESDTARRIGRVLDAHGATPNVVMVANTSPVVCEFVAAGVGLALVHPLSVDGVRDRVIVRPFKPTFQIDFQLCRLRDSRNARLVDAFLDAARATAAEVADAILDAGR